MAKERTIDLAAGEARRLLKDILSKVGLEDLDIKGNIGLQKVIESVLNKSQRQELAELSGQQKTDFLREQTRAFAEKRGIETAARAERAEINVAETGLLEEEKRVARARGEVRAEQVRQEAVAADPRRQQALAVEEQLSRTVTDSRRRLSDTELELLTERSVPFDAPNRDDVKKRLLDLNSADRRLEQSRAVRLLEAQGIPSEVSTPKILELQGRGGRLLTKGGKPSAVLQPVVSQLKQQVPLMQSLQRSAEGAGLRLSGPLDALEITETTRARLGAGSPRKTFTNVLQSAGRDIAGGAGESAMARVAEASKAMKSSTALRRLGGAGAAAALLLPSLINAVRGQGEQQTPPAQQIQLLQALSQLQQNQQLSESLVGSRDAQAALNLARAQLLQSQLAGSGDRTLVL